jgi:hypothetical protein
MPWLPSPYRTLDLYTVCAQHTCLSVHSPAANFVEAELRNVSSAIPLLSGIWKLSGSTRQTTALRHVHGSVLVATTIFRSQVGTFIPIHHCCPSISWLWPVLARISPPTPSRRGDDVQGKLSAIVRDIALFPSWYTPFSL